MTEYGIILLHKCKVEQTEVISRLFITFLLTNYKNIWSDRTSHFKFPNKFPCILHSYNIMSTGNIHRITYWKYIKHPIKLSLKMVVGIFRLGNFPTTELPIGSFQPRKVPPRKSPPRIFPLISLIVFLHLILCS